MLRTLLHVTVPHAFRLVGTARTSAPQLRAVAGALSCLPIVPPPHGHVRPLSTACVPEPPLAFDPWHPPVSATFPPHLVPTRDRHRASFQPDTVRGTAAELGIEYHKTHVYDPQRQLFQTSLAAATLCCAAVYTSQSVLSLGTNFRIAHTRIWEAIQPLLNNRLGQFEATYREVNIRVKNALQELEKRSSRGAMAELMMLDPDSKRQFLNCTDSRDRFVRQQILKALTHVHDLDSVPESDFVALCTGLIYNHPMVASQLAFDAVVPLVRRAATELGIPQVPWRHPMRVVTVFGGAPTSGKSSARYRVDGYLQRTMTDLENREVPPKAAIDADIFRRALLDPSTLSGEDAHWHAALTNCEISTTLERLILWLRQQREGPQILHFDNFYVDEATLRQLSDHADETLLSVYFIPPLETLRRNIRRGMEIGRFMGLDVLEKYQRTNQAIPNMINRLVGAPIKVELVYKHVPLGHAPPVVFYSNLATRRATVFDVEQCMRLVQYGKVNPNAKQESELFKPGDLRPESNISWLVDCARAFDRLQFARSLPDQQKLVYARTEKRTDGSVCFTVLNTGEFEQQSQIPWARVAFGALQNLA